MKEIKSGELVDFPDETYIPLSQFVDYKNNRQKFLRLFGDYFLCMILYKRPTIATISRQNWYKSE